MNTYLKPFLLIIVSVLIISSIVFFESRKVDRSNTGALESTIITQSSSERTQEKEIKYERAKEISTPDNFINTTPFTIEELIGKKVVLIDFWTYSCINCQRTLPYLNAWHEKYADEGLVIVGLHTPEFEFEKVYENVKQAVEKWNVLYPVVLDNDYSTWHAYRNLYWPHKYLIDIDGFIVYDHIGEGGYDETEARIVEALNERSKILGKTLGEETASEMLEVEKSVPSNIDEVNFGQIKTPEIYFGYFQLEYLSNLTSTECFGKDCYYTSLNTISANTFMFGGNWNIKGEQATFTGGGEGMISLAFSASKVNLVAGTLGETVKAEIYLDGKLVDASNGGKDVANGVVEFRSHDLYNLIDLKGDYGQHVLIIKILEPNLEVFAFTFG